MKRRRKKKLDFAEMLEGLVHKVRTKKPIRFFLYLEDGEQVFSIPFIEAGDTGVSKENYSDLLLSEQVELMYRMVRHLEKISLYNVVLERMDLEDSGQFYNEITLQ